MPMSLDIWKQFTKEYQLRMIMPSPRYLVMSRAILRCKFCVDICTMNAIASNDWHLGIILSVLLGTGLSSTERNVLIMRLRNQEGVAAGRRQLQATLRGDLGTGDIVMPGSSLDIGRGLNIFPRIDRLSGVRYLGQEAGRLMWWLHCIPY